VLTTDVGSVREMVEEGGSAVIVPSDDTTALRDGFARLCADADTRARLGRRGREIVLEKFRIEQMCAARERLFERLIPR
jgi:glycosyltransferase involved in cell wall biosynthesis